MGHSTIRVTMDVYAHTMQDTDNEATEKLAAIVFGGSKTVATGDAASQEASQVLERNGGWGRNRTGVHGFAGRCITTLPPSPKGSQIKKGKRAFLLSPSPFAELERETRLELATPTLARLCSTN